MAKDTITDELEKAEKYLKPRLDRIKEDIEKRYLLSPYTYTDLDNRQHKGINNVTMNTPRLYADAMIRILGTAKRRWSISCGDEKALADAAEKFLDWCITKSDENLVYQNLMPLEAAHNFQSCVEGTIAARVILYHDEKADLWYPELLPVDPYSITYVPGKKGCRIVRIKTKRSAGDIFKDYGVTVQGNTGTVEDIWTIDENIIKIDDKEIRRVKHPLGMNPIIVVLCPTTPFLSSQEDVAKYEAEGIFAGVRDMFEVENREATGWSTQNWMAFLPPIITKLKGSRKLPKVDFGIAAQIPIEPDEDITGWPIKDFSTSHQMFYSLISTKIQQATFANIQFGQTPFELSAVAIKELSAKHDQHFVPRLMAKKMFMVQAAYSLIEQFTNGGYPTDLKGAGEKITEWKPEDFKSKDFVIKVDYFAESPEDNIADTTVALSDQNLGLPPEWIYTNRLKIADVPEVMRMRAREIAIKLSPVAAQYYCGQILKDSPDAIDRHIAELLMEEPSGGEPMPQPASQPAPQLGAQMPSLLPKGSPTREQLRRQGVSPEGQSPPPGR